MHEIGKKYGRISEDIMRKEYPILGNSTEFNCIVLCSHCHGKTNHKKEKWEKYFKEIMFNKKEIIEKERQEVLSNVIFCKN